MGKRRRQRPGFCSGCGRGFASGAGLSAHKRGTKCSQELKLARVAYWKTIESSESENQNG